MLACFGRMLLFYQPRKEVGEVKHTREQVREALMRLSMCARKECEICKYKDRPKTELPSDDCKERSTKNMNILADVCLRDAHPTEKGGAE
jgi:hypothetical protein